MPTFLRIVVLFALMFCVFSCEDSHKRPPQLSIHGGEPVIVPKSYLTEFSLKVYVLKSTAEVTKFYTELTGKKPAPGTTMAGFQAWGTKKSTQEKVCIVVISEPTTVDDDSTLSAGHELWHCVAGNYHK